jgi:hypothetical protein
VSIVCRSDHYVLTIDVQYTHSPSTFQPINLALAGPVMFVAAGGVSKNDTFSGTVLIVKTSLGSVH